MSDLTEDSLEDLIKQIHGDVKDYRLTPTRFIVPPWVMKEIVAEFGSATEENYHRWNMKRLGLTELKYWNIIGKSE
jgi:hypothetical protein